MSKYPYQPHNSVQRDLDDIFKMTGGQIVHLRVDWAKRLGSIHTAIVLQQLIFRGRLHADPEGWFYVTAEVMEDETAVGEKGYAAARKKLESEGLIETVRRGLPRRLWIRLKVSDLVDWVDQAPTIRERIQSRQLSEQAKRNVATSSDTSQPLSRQRTEQLNETVNETKNDDGESAQNDLPMWQRLDPKADADAILRNRHSRPELPPPTPDVPVKLIEAWVKIQNEWDAKYRR